MASSLVCLMCEPWHIEIIRMPFLRACVMPNTSGLHDRTSQSARFRKMQSSAEVWQRFAGSCTTVRSDSVAFRRSSPTRDRGAGIPCSGGPPFYSAEWRALRRTAPTSPARPVARRSIEPGSGTGLTTGTPPGPVVIAPPLKPPLPPPCEGKRPEQSVPTWSLPASVTEATCVKSLPHRIVTLVPS